MKILGALLIIWILSKSAQSDLVDVAFANFVSSFPGASAIGWTSTNLVDACANNWQGITCLPTIYDNGTALVTRVIPRSVSLTNVNLGGSLSVDINNMFLRTLTLLNCNVGGSLPANIFAGDSLTSVDLGRNSLSGGLPTNYPVNYRLQFISLRSNGLTGSVPSSMSNLKALTSLDLSSNLLSGPWPSQLSANANLTSLITTNNTESLCTLKPISTGATCAADAYQSCGCSSNLCSVSGGCNSSPKASGSPLGFNPISMNTPSGKSTSVLPEAIWNLIILAMLLIC